MKSLSIRLFDLASVLRRTTTIDETADIAGHHPVAGAKSRSGTRGACELPPQSMAASGPDAQDQQHLLRGGRPRPAALARLGHRCRRCPRLGGQPHADPGPADAQLAQPQVGIARASKTAASSALSCPPSTACASGSARVQVRLAPDWFFVKLHTHGAPEYNQRVLLGEPMVQFHRDLARLAQANPHFRFHYVTAREMYNLAPRRPMRLDRRGPARSRF